MAQKVTIVLQDDLDGSRADETVRFRIGGTEYEIDLSRENAAAFRQRLAPFIESARRAGPAQHRRRGRSVVSRERSGDIRAWAKQMGYAVSERGRIPARVVEQYIVLSQPSPRPPGTGPRPPKPEPSPKPKPSPKPEPSRRRHSASH
jgi:hypothetical protein